VENLFNDQEVLIELLGMAIWDRTWLRSAGDLVTVEDFKPTPRAGREGEGTDTWLLADMALDFYRVNRTPLGSLIKQELLRWKQESNASPQRVAELVHLIRHVRSKYHPERAEVLIKQVVEFKKRVRRQRALREAVELEGQRQLDDDNWMRIMREGMDLTDMGAGRISEWTSGVDVRQQRRMVSTYRRTPVLLIDELDAAVKSVGRGELGLWLGPYKMGKSLAMIWTAVAYLWQGLNVLYFTLEDPLNAVEDRFDACVTELPIEDLATDKEMEPRFKRFKGALRSRIRIVDGTEGRMSLNKIEQVYERQRILGFQADAIIVDYDDEIQAPFKRQERRHEFADIYRGFRTMVSKFDVIGWLAAQAIRKSENQKVIGGSMVAEDISKIRKVTMAIGIGQGDWGPDSRYLYIAVHRNSKQKIGFTIWSDPEKALFYDRTRTIQYIGQQQRGKTPTGGGVI